jgi:hypothetical protein
MPLYTILGTREIYYEFVIEAESEAEALEEINRIELSENVEDYAYNWFPIKVTNTKQEEVVS